MTRLTLPAPDQGFAASRTGGLTLVRPRADKHDWELGERWWRSMVLDDAGRVVSAGFPKFFNWGEGPGMEDTARVIAAITAGEPAWFSEKLDGSLIIRSVVNGDVLLRTRGTLDGGAHGATARQVLIRECPLLLNPEYRPWQSLLLELTGPTHRVVIPYAVDALTLLGVVEHDPLRLLSPAETHEIGAVCRLQVAPTHELPRDPDELIAIVRSWEGREGVVVRLDDGTMVKLKSEAYLALHALAFSLTPRKVIETCAEQGITSVPGWKKLLADQGLDWETETATEPIVQIWLAAAQRSEEDLDLASELTERHEALDQKDFAAAVLPHGHIAHACFALRSGKQGVAQELGRRWAVDLALREVPQPGEAISHVNPALDHEPLPAGGVLSASASPALTERGAGNA